MLGLDRIYNILLHYYEEYCETYDVKFRDKPLIACCSVFDSLWVKIKNVHPWHKLPRDLLAYSMSVIVYAIPLSLEAIESNTINDEPSTLWLKEYMIANEALEYVGKGIVHELKTLGYKSIYIRPTGEFNRDSLISTWSHRHVGYIAGLGTFGLNNMLITRLGCCVRLCSVITEARVETTSRPDTEYCLEKRGIPCRVCVYKCPVNALENWGTGKFRCFSRLLEIASKYRAIIGYEVQACGKCLVGLPCSLRIP